MKEHRVPTISFTHQTVSTHDFAKELAAKDICIWSGHNYALELVMQLGLDEQRGVVHIGIAHYNTSEEEIDLALDAINSLLQRSSAACAPRSFPPSRDAGRVGSPPRR
ncbi:aminotransferase class V-fold PLP-dependent enzyme [Rhizobium beringeri]|uniref:aminotransferase class V-fold PLP-dependent enzyme n=1 Tax=Rhizobium beringeri TaxID=3019934 RepID=UPI003B5B276D